MSTKYSITCTKRIKDMATKPKTKPDQKGSKRPPKRPNAMDGRRKGDIKTEELLAGMTKAEINASIDAGENPKKDKPKPKRGGKDRVKKTGDGLRNIAAAMVQPALPGVAAAAGRAAKKVVKKAGGGKVCRGMGAATQGGKFRVS